MDSDDGKLIWPREVDPLYQLFITFISPRRDERKIVNTFRTWRINIHGKFIHLTWGMAGYQFN